MTNEQKFAKIIRTRWEKLYQDQTEIFDDVEMFYQMYRTYMTQDDSYPWDYQLVDPIVFQLIRAMMARLNPQDMTVALEATNSRSYGAKDANQSFVNWELSEMGKTLAFYRFIFRGLIAGRAYLQTGWLYNKAVEVQGDGGIRKIMRDIVNRADIKNVKFSDVVVPNRNVPDLKDQPYIIQKVLMNFGDMLDDNETEGKEVWKVKYLDIIKKKKMWATKVDYGVDLLEADEEKIAGKKEDWTYRSQYVELLKMQTKDGEIFYTPIKEEDWILNNETQNPYWHGHYDLISWTPFPEDDEYYSLGIVQPVADLQIAASSTLNQYLTLARNNANPMWIAGAAASQTPDWQFVNRPNGVIRVAGDVGQIQQMQAKDNGNSLIEMRRELSTVIEKTTSMSSLYTSGVSGGGSAQVNKTATGAKVIDANIDLNIQMIVALFGSQALKELGEHILELNAQYVTEEQEYRITGRKGLSEYLKIKPEEITANFDVVAKPETILKVSPVVRQASLLNLKATMDQEKDVKLDKAPVWEAIIDSFPEMDNVGDVILDPVQDANDAIAEILKGIEPEVTPNQDHKTIVKVVQFYVIEHSAEIDDELLQAFAKFLDEHRKWIEMEQNPNLVTMQPQPGQEMLPVNEADLAASMAQTGQSVNPLANQPVAINQNDVPGLIPDKASQIANIME